MEPAVAVVDHDKVVSGAIHFGETEKHAETFPAVRPKCKGNVTNLRLAGPRSRQTLRPAGIGPTIGFMLLRIPFRNAAFLLAALAAAALFPSAACFGDDAPRNATDDWAHLSSQPTQPDFPASWKGNPPPEAEVAKWLAPEGQRLVRLADEAKQFWRTYPSDPRSGAALKIESDALYAAMRLHAEGAQERLEEVDRVRLSDPGVPPDEKLGIRMRQIETEASAKMEDSPLLATRIYIDGAHALLKDFPGRPEPYAMLLEVSADGAVDESRAILSEVATSDAPERIRNRAQGMLRRLDALGKPLELKFTAVDGREVDLQKMKGKVVLIDLWATWCGPCVAGMPKVRETYEKLRSLDFEIIGISFDSDREALEKFLQTSNLPWPQYFDGEGWENKFGRQYGVSAIPSMWLVDRKGVLRDLHAEAKLAEKVQLLMKE